MDAQLGKAANLLGLLNEEPLLLISMILCSVNLKRETSITVKNKISPFLVTWWLWWNSSATEPQTTNCVCVCVVGRWCIGFCTNHKIFCMKFRWLHSWERCQTIYNTTHSFLNSKCFLLHVSVRRENAQQYFLFCLLYHSITIRNSARQLWIVHNLHKFLEYGLWVWVWINKLSYKRNFYQWILQIWGLSVYPIKIKNLLQILLSSVAFLHENKSVHPSGLVCWGRASQPHRGLQCRWVCWTPGSSAHQTWACICSWKSLCWLSYNDQVADTNTPWQLKSYLYWLV